MNEIKEGYWVLSSNGIELNHPEGLAKKILPDQIWDTTVRNNHVLWEWPLHFAGQGWVDEGLIVDLIKILELARSIFPTPINVITPDDIDINTVKSIIKILESKECEFYIDEITIGVQNNKSS